MAEQVLIDAVLIQVSSLSCLQENLCQYSDVKGTRAESLQASVSLKRSCCWSKAAFQQCDRDWWTLPVDLFSGLINAKQWQLGNTFTSSLPSSSLHLLILLASSSALQTPQLPPNWCLCVDEMWAAEIKIHLKPPDRSDNKVNEGDGKPRSGKREGQTAVCKLKQQQKKKNDDAEAGWVSSCRFEWWRCVPSSELNDEHLFTVRSSLRTNHTRVCRCRCVCWRRWMLTLTASICHSDEFKNREMNKSVCCDL